MGRATPGRITAVVILVVFAFGTLRWFVPFVSGDRTVITSSPSLAGVFSSNQVRVKPRAVLCVAPVPFDPASQLVRLNVTSARRASPLAIEARGPGYVARTRLAHYALGTGVGVSAPLTAPRREVSGSLCVRNAGRSSVSLTGTQEPRSLVAAQTTLDGKVLPAQGIAVSFFAARPAALDARAGTIAGHVSALAGGLLPTWLLWPLAVLFLVGLPLLTAAVFLVRDPERP